MAESLNLDTQAFNGTMRKFGAPETCIRCYQHWCVLLRPAQVTLGALVLAAFEPVKAFSDLSSASFTELKVITEDIESCLKRAFSWDRMNYLMLMMVDPDVHFHVIPRYAENRSFAESEFVDAGWPGPPELGQVNDTNTAMNNKIFSYLSQNWNQ